MALFQFLAEVMQRFGLAFVLDPWYFVAVEAIGFLPQWQVTEILNAYGHYVQPGLHYCGLAVMNDDGALHRTVSQIWIAEPGPECPVDGLRFAIDHELRHAWVWLTQGLTVWPGHN